jgi:predicted small lipoprotein YifL
VSRCSNRRIACFAIGAFTLALATGGCGRKGPLDPPPSALGPVEAAPAALPASANPLPRRAPSSPPAFGPSGEPIAARVPKRPLPIDWLLD